MFDAALFIAKNLTPIGKDIREDLRKNSVSGVIINGLESNPHHEEMIKKIGNILDQDPNLINRFLHLKLEQE